MLTTHLARNTDPVQCHEAADRSAAFRPTHCDRIINALRALGPRTAHELEPATGLTYVQIDRRMHELVAAGLARPYSMVNSDGCTLVKRATPTGGQAQVWEAVP